MSAAQAYYLENTMQFQSLLGGVSATMGILRKLGLALAAYVILGTAFSLLLLIGLYSVSTHIIIYVLYLLFQPVFFVINVLYHTWLF